MSIKFTLDKTGKQGIVSGDGFEEIREVFSVNNESARFMRYRSRFAPSRKYVITPTGKFDLGLFFDIRKYLLSQQKSNIFVEDSFRAAVLPRIKSADDQKLNLDLRDYQKQIVDQCLSRGRGVCVLATAGGKTLTIASLIENVFKTNTSMKCLVIVPDLGLVTQTHNDFRDYGVSFLHSKWTGSDNLNLGSNVIIANLGILQSSKTDTSWIEHIDMLIVDEVHKLRKTNKINKLIKRIRTNNRFGFTGTMPEDKIDQWNIIGKIGPILFERGSYQLRQDDHISPVVAQILKIEYKDSPPAGKRGDPTDGYRKESSFLIESQFRNNLLAKLCNKFDNNALIMIDYIKHGETLYDTIKSNCPEKTVYFIRGDVDVSEREVIKRYIENKSNVVVIAISKIFSTGVNIKNLHYIVFAGGGKAKIKILQSIGRGLRKHASKDRLTIIDIADQLKYGYKHMTKRLTFYKKEKIDYGIKKIIE
jgi:superfamily II DNA or RNA helicase